MPVCTTCAHRADYLYTTYRTKSNIRLNVCPRCSAFLDPLIEHPPLLIILDLILLKPRVFLHLLYNRGTLPLDATKPSQPPEKGDQERDSILHQDLVRLVGVTLAAETFVRLSGRTKDVGMAGTVRLLGIVGMEMVAQYTTTLGLALFALWLKGWWIPHTNPEAARRNKGADGDGRRENFRPILIPLTLLYTSILPLLLHLLLSIWYRPPPPSHPDISLISLSPHLPPFIPNEVVAVFGALPQVWQTTDRIWGGTRLLGGMSAGFGLRVVLPTKPWETTGIVLAGWAAAAGVGHLLGVGSVA